MDPVRIWHTDHKRFIRLLDYLQNELAAFHAGGDPNYQLMHDAVYYLHHYADLYHHPREDVAFGLLVRHDPGFGDLVNRLKQEHRAISESGATLLGLLELVLEDTIIARSKVEAAAALYILYLRSHINTEDHEILPRVGQILTYGDWGQVAAAGPVGADPLFGDDPLLRFRNLREWIDRDDVSASVVSSGVPVSPLAAET
jgi:hemerythrin-like domain-containing protein